MEPPEVRGRVADALNAVDFPASKQLLADCVADHPDTDVVRAVRGLPLGEYDNLDEVLRSIHVPGGPPSSKHG